MTMYRTHAQANQYDIRMQWTQIKFMKFAANAPQ